MLSRQTLSQSQRLSALLERGAYTVSEAEARADWTGETAQAKFQGAAQADRVSLVSRFFAWVRG